MKRKMLALALAAIMVVPSISGCGGSSDSGSAATGSKTEDSASTESSGDDGEITLTIWDWDEAHLTHMTEWYHEKHPNINFDTLVVSTADYMQKLQSALASGSGVPDIILSEMAYRGKVWDLGITEDLSKDPYNVKKEDMFDFATDLGSGPNGELYGVEQQICPSGFAYRRDLAKEYLGTDDPDEIADMISDVSDYIDGNKIDLTSRYTKALDIATKFNQAGILGKQEANTPAYNSSFAAGEVIFYPCAPWAAKWEEATNDPDGSGNWGLTKAPENGFTYGGTSVSIYSGSEHKDAAWEYIQDVYCTGDGVKEAYEQFGFMTGFKAPYEDKNSYFFTEDGQYDEFFGRQKLADYFINDIAINTVGQVQTKNEANVRSAIGNTVSQMAADPSMTTEEALEILKTEVQTLVPEAEIK